MGLALDFSRCSSANKGSRSTAFNRIKDKEPESDDPPEGGEPQNLRMKSSFWLYKSLLLVIIVISY